MKGYQLTEEADKDLQSIARYTVDTWGRAQAVIYMQALEQCFNRIVNGEAPSKQFSERIPSVLVMRCEHHYIFYRLTHGEPLLILAVFHDRMDLMVRLQGRLSL